MSILIMNPTQFSIENLFFMDAVKNMVMKNGDFIKFLYSDDNCIMNSIYFELALCFTRYERTFHKIKLLYDPLQYNNLSCIRQLYNIEKSILEYYHPPGKKPIYKISENMYNGNINFNLDECANILPDVKNMIIVKISGIWENSAEYGVTYKFITEPI
jgi:hypothetical protein